MRMEFQKEMEIALQAAGLAGERILGDYESFVPIPDAPVDISTDTDKASQDLILSFLVRTFPDDAFCAEENTPIYTPLRKSGERVWVIDPIDGTRGFAQKNGEFSVMIGLLVKGIPVVGVVLEPVARRVTFALRQGGCWSSVDGENPVRCHVRPTGAVDASILIQSHSRDPGKLTRAARLFNPVGIISTHSAGVKLASVARGESDIYVNTYNGCHDWDICAGHILVTEAGGRVTDLSGEPLVYGQANFVQPNGLFGTSGRIHAEVVRLWATGSQ